MMRININDSIIDFYYRLTEGTTSLLYSIYQLNNHNTCELNLKYTVYYVYYKF